MPGFGCLCAVTSHVPSHPNPAAMTPVHPFLQVIRHKGDLQLLTDSNTATITDDKNLVAGSGLLHVIDAVLMP